MCIITYGYINLLNFSKDIPDYYQEVGDEKKRRWELHKPPFLQAVLLIPSCLRASQHSQSVVTYSCIPKALTPDPTNITYTN